MLPSGDMRMRVLARSSLTTTGLCVVRAAGCIATWRLRSRGYCSKEFLSASQRAAVSRYVKTSSLTFHMNTGKAYGSVTTTVARLPLSRMIQFLTRTLPVHENLERFVSLIEADEQLSALMKLDQRSSQITVFPRALHQDDVWEALQDLCRACNQPLVRSTHSFDILAPSVSKLNVVRKIAEVLGVTDSPTVLRIGDLGRWPGNDHELLADEYGLSVDQASCHPAQCWNFAPAGHRGTQATLDYLDALSCSNGAASLDLKRLDV